MEENQNNQSPQLNRRQVAIYRENYFKKVRVQEQRFSND